MAPTPHVNVRIDLGRIRANVQRIAQQTGVAVIAVVKADAYGLGAQRVAAAIGDLVRGFYVFDAGEAVSATLWERTHKPTISLLGDSNDPQDYLAKGIRPAVWTVERARSLRKAHPVLCVDTGQQRFACPAKDVRAVVQAGQIDEAFTHATSAQQVAEFKKILSEYGAGGGSGGFFKHATGTKLLANPSAWLDAIRPGLALYRDAVRVGIRLAEVRDSTGPAGYTGFVVPRHGVIAAGYSNGLRAGPCLVNGRPSRLLEVGMQSAFVECEAHDRVGDEVVLLGEGLEVGAIGAAWNTTPHEALLRLASSGKREYVLP
jgi:alanine racemase